MDRRRFLQLGAAAAAMTALDGCARNHLLSTPSMTGSTELTAAEYRAARRFIDTEYGRIAYIDQGSGPAVLFLHGFPLNSFQWRGLIPRLSAHRRCIAPDFLAMGFTEVFEGKSVTPEAQLAMLVQFLDKLSIPSVDVIANDSGGAIAQLFMTRHPKLIRSVLLTNCDTEFDSPPPAVLPVIELARAGRYADEWLVPWVADKNLARSEKGLGGLCYAEPAHLTDEAIETYLGPLVSSARRKTLTNAYAIGLAPNPLAGIERALKRSTVPTRIIWGSADDIFSQKSPEYLESVLGNSRGVRRIPGMKLFFPEEVPALIAEEAVKLWGV